MQSKDSSGGAGGGAGANGTGRGLLSRGHLAAAGEILARDGSADADIHARDDDVVGGMQPDHRSGDPLLGGICFVCWRCCSLLLLCPRDLHQPRVLFDLPADGPAEFLRRAADGLHT